MNAEQIYDVIADYCSKWSLTLDSVQIKSTFEVTIQVEGEVLIFIVDENDTWESIEQWLDENLVGDGQGN